jgi:hypothetical protein
VDEWIAYVTAEIRFREDKRDLSDTDKDITFCVATTGCQGHARTKAPAVDDICHEWLPETLGSLISDTTGSGGVLLEAVIVQRARKSYVTLQKVKLPLCLTN